MRAMTVRDGLWKGSRMAGTDKLSRAELHPADRLSAALERANGMLSVLRQCYDPGEESFVVSHAFVVQAILAMEGFIGEAQNSHNALCTEFEDHLKQTQQTGPSAAKPAGPIAQQMASIIEEKAPEPVPVPLNEAVAKNYEELLRKLTAAEVFAQEQQAILMPGTASPLVPLLRGLRDDLRKVHAA